MLDSFTLLADATTGGKRTSLLKSDDGRFQVRARLASVEDWSCLLIRATTSTGNVVVALDGLASILATSTGTDLTQAEGHAKEEILRKFASPSPKGDYLLADHVDGPRRTSVLKADTGGWSLRVKVLDTGDEHLLQLRIELPRVGYAHVVLDQDGAVMALVTGATDSDAWSRLQGELRRREIDPS